MISTIWPNWTDPKTISAADDERVILSVLEQRPALIKGLLGDAPISQISTADAAATELSKVPLLARSEYYRTFVKTGSLVPDQLMRLSFPEFLQAKRRGIYSDLVVTEQPCPPELAELLAIPGVCHFRHGQDGTNDIESEVFVAEAGKYAHLHFDWDHRNVLLYQVFGRKRVAVLPPSISPILRPILNTSRLVLQDMRNLARTRLIRGLGGLDVILEPGDALFIPALAWHYVEYLDTAMSVTFRFGRHSYGRFYAERLHPNYYLQAFAWQSMNEIPLQGERQSGFELILNEYLSADEFGAAFFSRISAICRKVYNAHCPDFQASEIWCDSQNSSVEARSVVDSGLYAEGRNKLDDITIRRVLTMCAEKGTP